METADGMETAYGMETANEETAWRRQTKRLMQTAWHGRQHGRRQANEDGEQHRPQLIKDKQIRCTCTFDISFLIAYRQMNSVKAAMDAIMEPGVACQFNMRGRHRRGKTTTTVKGALDKMANIIDCIVEAYRGRPIEKPHNEEKFGGSEETRGRWS
jgi:hypothetical protein